MSHLIRDGHNFFPFSLRFLREELRLCVCVCVCVHITQSCLLLKETVLTVQCTHCMQTGPGPHRWKNKRLFKSHKRGTTSISSHTAILIIRIGVTLTLLKWLFNLLIITVTFILLLKPSRTYYHKEIIKWGSKWANYPAQERFLLAPDQW